jgi:8-oxo-dGTP diphosphatase
MQSWNVIYLIDQTPFPSKIVLLKRSSTKKFAPGMYTGIGGKVEENETVLESAYRELLEESGINNIQLTEFAKVFIDESEELVYFWGIYTPTNVPETNEGKLEWVPIKTILDKDIIPTTKEMINKWQTQNFSIQPFELHVKTISSENGIKKVVVK